MPKSLRDLLRYPQTWIVSVFILSRAAYYAAGIRFDAHPLSSFFQIADPRLLQDRLLETLLYLHTQPPGFNLMIGLVLKAFPVHYAAALHSIYLLCGLSLCFTLYELMRMLGVRPKLAAGFTALFLVTPGAVLFENFLLYEYPMTALLSAAAVLLYRLVESPRFWTAFWFFSCLTALIYLRAFFNIGWLIALALILAWILKAHRRMILGAALVPLLAAAALNLKNAVLFGTLSTSTWMGFNADTITLHQLTGQEHERLVASGVLSPVGLIPATEPLARFHDFIQLPPPTGIPVLDQLEDSTGRINYNHAGYLLLHPFYLADAKAIVLHYPRAYLRSIARACFTYFLPASDYPGFELNRPRIARFDRWVNVALFGQWMDATNRKELRRLDSEGSTMLLPLYCGTYLLLGIPLLFTWSAVRLWRELRSGNARVASTVLLAFLVFHVAYISVLVNLLSCFENNRYRLPIDPFLVAMFAMALQSGFLWFQKKRQTEDILSGARSR